MGQMRSVCLKLGPVAILLVLTVGSCRRESRDGAEALTGSLIFDNTSPDVREALASPVDFIITDDNFARWEQAQRHLETLKRSAIPSGQGTGRTAVDRAVSRLESSPYVRTAIERTGLSVRDFVLETIALAQATEAAQTGKSTSRGPIPSENFKFVQRYTTRALYSNSRVRTEPRTYDWDADAAGVHSDQTEMDLQMQLDDADHQADSQLGELEMRREEIERQAEKQREEMERQTERQREEMERQVERQRESMERRAERDREETERAAEIKRDTLPAQR
jgi:hypothetical protein